MADNYLQNILSWMQSPERTQQVQQLGGLFGSAVNKLQQSQQEEQALQAQAFGNPQRPLQITDPEAFRQLYEKDMAGPVSIAPVGMVVGRGVLPEAIARANQMLNNGKSPGFILQETGLVQVPTKEGFTWGKQISDAPLSVDFEKMLQTPYDGSRGVPLKAGDVIQHDELFNLYPELKNLDIYRTYKGDAFYTNADGGAIGLPSGQFIKESTSDPKAIARRFNEINGFAAHELQHAIQNIDNMPKGASPENFKGFGYKNVEKQADWALKSLKDTTELFLEKQGLTAPKDFKSFAQSVQYIKANGPKYLEDVGPESKKRIEAILSSDKADSFLDTFSRIETAYSKIKSNENKARTRYRKEAGEAQARATEQQFLENNYKAPVNSFYDIPVTDLLYRDPFNKTIK